MSKSLIDNSTYENNLFNNGINYIAGIDEVGRGPLVGPVVAACVLLPKGFHLEGLTDSKKLSEKKREEFFSIIYDNALGIGVGIVSSNIIDDINIYEATKKAMYDAFKKIKHPIEHVLIDAMKLPELKVTSTSIIKGDLNSYTIAAASVIAKVTRDRILDELDLKHPQYGFKNNKGYPTKKHLLALEKYGIISEHRKSYKPVAKYINK